MFVMRNLISLLFIALLALSPKASHANALFECMTEQCQSYFKKFIEHKNDHRALYMLGHMYYSGYGTVKDEDMALKYFRLSGKLGYAYAKYHAAVIYLTDEKQDNDYLGLKLLKRAALSGNAESAFKLAMIYVNGEYGTSSLSRADKWLALSYAYNHAGMVDVIQQIKEKSSFNLADFPKLTRAIKKVKFSDKSIQTDNENSDETLILTAMFDQSLSDIKRSRTNRHSRYFPNQQATLGANRQAYYGGHKGPYGTK